MILKLLLSLVWLLYAFEGCYHFHLQKNHKHFENNNNTIHTQQTTHKPALESQQTILLRENNNNKNKNHSKFSLIHNQNSCRFWKLLWLWIKLGWIMSFKVKDKDLFICSCWSVNAQLNCRHLKHRAFSETMESKPFFRLQLRAFKILSHYFLGWKMVSNHSWSEDKRALNCWVQFPALPNIEQETHLECHLSLKWSHSIPLKLWTLYDLSFRIAFNLRLINLWLL